VGHSHHWSHHTIGPIQTNCYVLGTSDNAILFDPGGPEAEQIARQLLEKEIEIKHVFVSHGHYDHLGWAHTVQKVVEGAKVYLHIDEKPIYEVYLDKLKFYGVNKQELREPDIWITDKQTIKVSGYEFQIIHTPGHSPGSATYRLTNLPEHNNFPSPINIDTTFVGDCLFQGSIGRVDLEFGDPSKMKSSLLRLMNELPSHSQILPGHGNTTTMEFELKNNPFLLALQRNIDIF